MADVSDLTVIYYTANVISEDFANATLLTLQDAVGGVPVIVVSHKPIITKWKNIVVDLPRHHVSIYKQALIGAKAVKTKYIALAEDDVLYASEHFRYRPSHNRFAYNMNSWNIYTWEKTPVFSQKLGGRKNLNGLICERDLFIEAMEERFAKYPDYREIDLSTWAEPGKYEGYLGVTKREIEEFTTNPPNIVFSHESELSFRNLGTRKKVGQIRALEIPFWGTVESVRSLYG